MAQFLIEAYTRPSQSIAGIEERARRAAGELAGSGVPVTYERAIFVPADELCLHLLAGPSRDAVAEVARRAGISPVRVVEATAGASDDERGA